MPARVLWVIKALGPDGAERLVCTTARTQDRGRCHIECAFALPENDHRAEEFEQANVKTQCVSRKRPDWRWPLRRAELGIPADEMAVGQIPATVRHAPTLLRERSW